MKRRWDAVVAVVEVFWGGRGGMCFYFAVMLNSNYGRRPMPHKQCGTFLMETESTVYGGLCVKALLNALAAVNS